MKSMRLLRTTMNSISTGGPIWGAQEVIEEALRVAYRAGWDDADRRREEGSYDVPRKHFESTFMDDLLGEE